MINGKKFCWVAKQYKKGWRMGFSLGNDRTKYISVWFKSEEDIKKALGAGIVFVRMR
jgi:hypothetical protein